MRNRALILLLAASISLVTLLVILVVAFSSNNENKQNLSRTRSSASTGERETPESSPASVTAPSSSPALLTAPAPVLGPVPVLSPVPAPAPTKFIFRSTPLSYVEASGYALVTDRLNAAFFTTEDGEFLNLSTLELDGSPSTSYYYDPVAKALMERNQRISILGVNQLLIYKKKNGNSVIITTDKNLPLTRREFAVPLSLLVQRQR